MTRLKRAVEEDLAALPSLKVDVVEAGARGRAGWLRCEIGRNLDFSTERLESYCFAHWKPVVFDALLLAATVEFCDRTKRRPALGWGRRFELRIAVHDLERWNRPEVNASLHEALEFLTGDQWSIAFTGRKHPVTPPRQGLLDMPVGVEAVIPFSEGLDSRAVGGLMGRQLGDKLIRVRLGSKVTDSHTLSRGKEPFTSVPYRVRLGERRSVESSARSRGFKFAMVSGLAAYLVKARQVIVPESGQGALAPALVPVGQAYEDYRNHPLFTGRMEKFLAALFGHSVRFEFPRLWFTKGETLAAFVRECGDDAGWQKTLSCWQQSRQSSVDGHKRQCGICAACMLRRLSVHAAGLKEPKDIYVWEDLSAPDFNAGAAANFEENRITGAMHEYAIAGALHLDHLAGLRHSPSGTITLNLAAHQIGRSLGLATEDARARLNRLLAQHENEWKNFMGSLGPNSFVANWATHAR